MYTYLHKCQVTCVSQTDVQRNAVHGPPTGWPLLVGCAGQNLRRTRGQWVGPRVAMAGRKYKKMMQQTWGAAIFGAGVWVDCIYIYIIHISWYIYICWYISTNDEWKLSLMQRPWTTVDSHNFFQQQNDKVEPSLEIQEVLKRSQKRMIWYSKVKAASDSQGNQL